MALPDNCQVHQPGRHAVEIAADDSKNNPCGFFGRGNPSSEGRSSAGLLPLPAAALVLPRAPSNLVPRMPRCTLIIPL